MTSGHMPVERPADEKAGKKRFSTHAHWTTAFCRHGDCFAHLNALFGFADWPRWPDAAQLNRLLPEGTKTLSGEPLVFVAQDQGFDFAGRYYEQVIYESGQVPTRLNGWHDLFGALIWCLLPNSKALLNQLHYRDIQAHGLKTRTAQRNAITLLDECGVILAVSDSQFSEHLRGHRWHWSFVEKRSAWGQSIAPFIIGHANYEMLTRPYIGLTGKALFVAVESDFFGLDLASQYRVLDQRLCRLISEAHILKDNRQLSPLPLLGVPGWHDGNEAPGFYDNKSYFRDKQLRIRSMNE